MTITTYLVWNAEIDGLTRDDAATYEAESDTEAARLYAVEVFIDDGEQDTVVYRMLVATTDVLSPSRRIDVEVRHEITTTEKRIEETDQ